jgi:hypothetical protein
VNANHSLRAETAPDRPRWASPILAGLVGLWLALLIIAVVLAFAPSDTTLAIAPLWLVFGLVGVLVALHQPRNPVGWLLFAVALFFTTESDASGVSVLDYRHHEGVPLGSLAVLLQPTWAAAIVAAGVSVLLFPDGHLPSSRWRWPLRLLLAIAGLWQLGAFAVAVDAIARHAIQVDSGGNLLQTSHPHGNWAWWGVVQDVFFPSVGLYWVVWLVSQIPRYRGSTGERRLQLKWLLSGVSIFIISGALSVAAPTSSELTRVVSHVAFIGLFALPICIGIAILRYRLYEIDRLISRTLSYAILTGLLVGVFVGIVALATDVLPFSSPVAVAASTLAAAALFNPLRRRVQHLVDRRFNRARYDAEAIVAAFTLRLRDAVDLDTVRGELLHAVNGAVQPAHTSLWIRPPERRVP